MFNLVRFELARKRRRLSSKVLAEKSGVSVVTLSRISNGKQDADERTIERLVNALNYPKAFFFDSEVDLVDSSAASFRSLKAMTASERDSATAAASLAFLFVDWVQRKFSLPEADIPNFGPDYDPQAAARTLRLHWGIGEKPIGGLINLLEAKGVRVFSLAEDTKNVDAFSCWRGGEAYIFLNTFKSAERSRFDAAHELAHLVLHRHGGASHGRSGEVDANNFASAFLMPEADVVATIPYAGTLDAIIAVKKRWGVSAAALAYRLHKLGRISDWQYRNLCITLNRQFGRVEPNGIASEKSSIWQQVLRALWLEGISRSHIADELHLPHEEVENLIFGLTSDVSPPEKVENGRHLRVVS